MRELTLCVINYNGGAHLPQTFAAVHAQAWRFAEILVIDNASTDGSAELVQHLESQARVIRLDGNRGPGAARNRGIAAARFDRILFIDNDVQLESCTAERLLDELDAHADVLAVAPRVVYAADPATVQFDSADCHFLGLMATRNADSPAADASSGAADTTSLVTACFLFDRGRWTGGAPFDEGFGFNLEDHDFGVRACVAGHRLRVRPDARVRHGSGTAGLSYRPGAIPGHDREFYLTRNRWMVVAKCYSPRTLLLTAPALLAYELMQLVWLAGRGRGRIWSGAVGSLWRERDRLLRDRRAVQRNRRRGDGTILRDAPLPVTAHVRTRSAARLTLPVADGMFRTYWRVVRRWVR